MTTSHFAQRCAFPLVALMTTLATARCGSPTLGPPPEGNGGSVATSSTGATGSTGGGGAGGAGVPVCTSQSLGFEGVLDGQAVAGTPRTGIAGIGEVSPMPLLTVIFLEDQGMLVLPEFITDPTPHPLALLRMPDSGPFPGVWFGFGPGSELPMNDGSPGGGGFVLTGAVRLGTCPGTPVSGDLSYCYDSSGADACGGQMTQTTTTLGGQTIVWPGAPPGGIVAMDLFSQLYWQNNAFIVTDQFDGPIVGLLSMPLETGEAYGGPYADDIFCINGGNNGMPTATFTDLSFLTRFTEAPAVSGSIRGCF